MNPFAIVAGTLLCASPMPKDAPTAKRADAIGFSKRLQFQIDSLDLPIPQDKPIESPLKEVFDYFGGALTDEAAAEKEPSLRVRIRADDQAFKAARGENFMVEEESVRLPKMAGSPLRDALSMIAVQLGGCIAVHENHLLLTTFESLGIRNVAAGESRILVVQAFVNHPLDQAIEKLAASFGRTVAITGTAATKAGTLVTVKLRNVTFEGAVDALAEAADLRMVRKNNVLFVTTAERASAMREEIKVEEKRERKAANAPFDPAFMPNALGPPARTVPRKRPMAPATTNDGKAKSGELHD